MFRRTSSLPTGWRGSCSSISFHSRVSSSKSISQVVASAPHAHCAIRKAPSAASHLTGIDVFAGRREAETSISEGVSGKHLVDRHPAALEGMRGSGHVNVPDAVNLFARDSDGLLALCFQPFDPVPQGSGIVRSQALHVPAFEALLGHFLDDVGNVRELAPREHVFVDEGADVAADLFSSHGIQRNAVIEHDPTGFQEPPDLAEVARQVPATDVLEHPDARDLVVRHVFGHIAIVEQPYFAAILESRPFDPAARVRMLVFRKRDPRRAHAVVLGRPHDERAPAAADVEEALAGLQLKLAADVIELLFLRRLERVLGAAKIAARVDAPCVEPQPEELIAYVVVMPNRFAVENARVADPLAQPRRGAIAAVWRPRERLD